MEGGRLELPGFHGHLDQGAQSAGWNVRWSQGRGLIGYGEKDKEDTNDRLIAKAFEFLQWNGLQLFARTSFGGQVTETRTYQVIVRADGYGNELTITAYDLHVAASMIACASET